MTLAECKQHANAITALLQKYASENGLTLKPTRGTCARDGVGFDFKTSFVDNKVQPKQVMDNVMFSSGSAPINSIGEINVKGDRRKVRILGRKTKNYQIEFVGEEGKFYLIPFSGVKVCTN